MYSIRIKTQDSDNLREEQLAASVAGGGGWQQGWGGVSTRSSNPADHTVMLLLLATANQACEVSGYSCEGKDDRPRATRQLSCPPIHQGKPAGVLVFTTSGFISSANNKRQPLLLLLLSAASPSGGVGAVGSPLTPLT